MPPKSSPATLRGSRRKKTFVPPPGWTAPPEGWELQDVHTAKCEFCNNHCTDDNPLKRCRGCRTQICWRCEQQVGLDHGCKRSSLFGIVDQMANTGAASSRGNPISVEPPASNQQLPSTEPLNFRDSHGPAQTDPAAAQQGSSDRSHARLRNLAPAPPPTFRQLPATAAIGLSNRNDKTKQSPAPLLTLKYQLPTRDMPELQFDPAGALPVPQRTTNDGPTFTPIRGFFAPPPLKRPRAVTSGSDDNAPGSLNQETPGLDPRASAASALATPVTQPRKSQRLTAETTPSDHATGATQFSDTEEDETVVQPKLRCDPDDASAFRNLRGGFAPDDDSSPYRLRPRQPAQRPVQTPRRTPQRRPVISPLQSPVAGPPSHRMHPGYAARIAPPIRTSASRYGDTAEEVHRNYVIDMFMTAGDAITGPKEQRDAVIEGLWERVADDKARFPEAHSSRRFGQSNNSNNGFEWDPMPVDMDHEMREVDSGDQDEGDILPMPRRSAQQPRHSRPHDRGERSQSPMDYVQYTLAGQAPESNVRAEPLPSTRAYREYSSRGRRADQFRGPGGGRDGRRGMAIGDILSSEDSEDDAGVGSSMRRDG